MNKYLYTMSSNATKEYMSDILEALSSPKGCVHHYRYQLKYIDEELKNNLRYKGKSINENIKNIRTVICFLYQVNKGTEEKPTMEWDSVYPVRMGKLVEAYKTGDSDRDIAHIYFKVDDYLVYDGNSYTEIIKNALKEKYNNSYASLGNPIEKRYIAKTNESKQAFHKTCESIDIEHFQLPSGEKYLPVFTFIEGLSSGNTIKDLKYDKLTRTSYYRMSEGSRYVFSFSTYFKKQPPEFSIELTNSKDVFVTPEKYELNISSRYDEESWSLVSRILNQDTWSNFKFESNLDNIEGKKPLNINITFPVLIKRKMQYRTIEIISDVSYGFGIIALLISRVILEWSWWYIPVAILFPIWAITKGIARWWRG